MSKVNKQGHQNDLNVMFVLPHPKEISGSSGCACNICMCTWNKKKCSSVLTSQIWLKSRRGLSGIVSGVVLGKPRVVRVCLRLVCGKSRNILAGQFYVDGITTLPISIKWQKYHLYMCVCMCENFPEILHSFFI